MRKEVAIAIIGGFVLGLIVTFGVVTAQKSLDNRKSAKVIAQSPTPPPGTSIPSTPSLYINSPQPNSVGHDKELMVTGSAAPNSFISIIGTNGRSTTMTDEQGNFSVTYTLQTGAQILDIAAFTPRGDTLNQQLKAVYLPAQVTPAPTPTPTKKATQTLLFTPVRPAYAQDASPGAEPTTDEITENVRKRIQSVIKDKAILDITPEIAYIGTLQSLNNNTLSLLTDAGIKLASTSDDTTFIRLPANKAMTLADVAIDSYTLAIGVPGPDGVLTTTTVATQDTPPAAPGDKAFAGTLTAYDTKTFKMSVTHPASANQMTALVSRKAVLSSWLPDSTKNPLKRTGKLPLDVPVLVVYTPGGDPDGGDLIMEVLINELSKPTP